MSNISLISLIFGALLSCVFSITSKNPVISIIFLILTFVQTAIYLILKGIVFIGLSYIIIYVGAIAVIFLFVVMMINIRLTDILETENQYTKNLPLAIIIGYLFLLFITTLFELNLFNDLILSNQSEENLRLSVISYDILNNKFNLNSILNYNPSIFNNTVFNNNSYFLDQISSHINKFSESNLIEITQLVNVGLNLYTYYAILLIILGFVLLLGMFSAIIIPKNKN